MADPARFAEKAIRVTGTAEGETASLALSEGDARVALETDGGFALPDGLSGARLTAEGKLRRAEKGALVFVATGVEVRR